MRRLFIALFATFALATPAHAQASHLVLVTIDGYRWEDLFRGAAPSLVTDPAYRARYVDVLDRAAALTPFLLGFREHGALIGDRASGSCARVANDYWFSYPGYTEMLVGKPNPAIRSNAPTPNQHVTILERLNAHGDFANSVRVYAEWNVVSAILNTTRSNIPVFTPPDYDAEHDPQVLAAARALLSDLPRVTWLALGDTDNYAHKGDYHGYLRAASNADAFLRALWESIEADPETAGRTLMIVTVDHGRGGAQDNQWNDHGSGMWRGVRVPGVRREGSDAIFIAARGPGVRATSLYTMENCATLGQVAATALEGIGLSGEWVQPDMAAPLEIFQMPTP